MKEQMIRADFATIQEQVQIIRIGKSTVHIPEIQYSGKNIRWLDESAYMNEHSQGSEEEEHERDKSSDPGQGYTPDICEGHLP